MMTEPSLVSKPRISAPDPLLKPQPSHRKHFILPEPPHTAHIDSGGMKGPPSAYFDFLSRKASCAAQSPSFFAAVLVANCTSAAWKVRVWGSAAAGESV